MTQLPPNCENQCRDCDHEESGYRMTAEPIVALAAIQDHFQATEAECNQPYSNMVDTQFTGAARGLYLFDERRWILDHAARQDQRDDADRNVDEEDPAPREVVGDPSAERRTNRRRDYDRHAV